MHPISDMGLVVTISYKMIVCLILVLLAVSVAMGKNCLLIDQCSCKFDDNGSIIDLSSLGNKNNTPRLVYCEL